MPFLLANALASGDRAIALGTKPMPRREILLQRVIALKEVSAFAIGTNTTAMGLIDRFGYSRLAQVQMLTLLVLAAWLTLLMQQQLARRLALGQKSFAIGQKQQLPRPMLWPLALVPLLQVFHQQPLVHPPMPR